MRYSRQLILFLKSPTKFYVSPTGSDTNPGTLSQPWKTIQHASDTLKPGQEVFIRGGYYDEAVDIAYSGDLMDGRVVYQNYNDEPVVVGGSASLAAGYAIQVYAKQYVTIKGIAVTGAIGGAGFLAGIMIFRDSHHITISKVEAYGNKYGICCAASPTTIEDIVVEDCNLHHNTYMGVCFVDRTLNSIIRNNYIVSSGYHAIQIYHDGLSADGPENIDVYENEGVYNTKCGIQTWGCSRIHIHDNFFTNDGSTGVQVEDESKYIIVKKNISKYNSWLPEYAAETTYWTDNAEFVLMEDNVGLHTAIGLAISQSSNVIIRDNLFAFNNVSATGTLNRRGVMWYSLGNPVPSNMLLYHNDWYFNGDTGSQRAGNFNYADLLPDNIMTGTVVKNNIFSETVSAYDIWIGAGANVDWMNYNDIYNSQREENIRYANGARTLADYLSLSGRDSNSLSVDPLFTDPSGTYDFSLQDGSSCKNAGTYLVLTTDSGTGTEIGVDNPYYFCDGWGITSADGDDIIIEGKPCHVVSVDYGNKKLIIESPITWSVGDKINLPYSGSSPDIGITEEGLMRISQRILLFDSVKRLPLSVDFTTKSDGSLPSSAFNASPTWSISGGKALCTPGLSYNLAGNGVGGMYVNLGSQSSLDDLHSGTVDVRGWFRVPNNGTTQFLSLKGTFASTGWTFYIGSTGRLTAYVPATGTSPNPISPASPRYDDDAWHYFHFYYNNAGDRKGYLEAEGSNVATSSAAVGPIISDAAENASLGRSSVSLDGTFGWVEFSNAVRSSTVVPRNTPPSPDGNTKGLWTLSEGFGSVVADSSGNGNTGTITNASWWYNPDTITYMDTISVQYRYWCPSTLDVKAVWSIAAKTQAGVIGWLSNDKQSFLSAYHDGTKAYLDQWVNGTRTSLIATNATYGATKAIEIKRTGQTTFQLLYGGTQVGTDKTVNSPYIINNGYFRLFSTYLGNLCSSFDLS